MEEGKWLFSVHCDCWVCSVCGAAALNNCFGHSTPSNFCPHCGKPMTISEVFADG